VPLFDPEEQYDPNKPNDLGEYQAYRKRLREERRARLLEEKRRRAAGEDSEGSSYYTDSEEDAPRRDGASSIRPANACLRTDLSSTEDVCPAKDVLPSQSFGGPSPFAIDPSAPGGTSSGFGVNG
jgi:splicing factor 45